MIPNLKNLGGLIKHAEKNLGRRWLSLGDGIVVTFVCVCLSLYFVNNEHMILLKNVFINKYSQN